MKILDLFFPQKCAFCGELINSKSKYYICTSCLEKHKFLCKADVLPSGALKYIVQVYCPLVYTGDVKDALIRYKFNSENWLHKPFSLIMHEFLKFNKAYSNFDIITYVPISDARFKARGYNQSELIAKDISKLCKLPLVNTMKRVSKDKIKTSGLNRAERLSMCRFTHIEECTMIIGKRILLVDDILTTGSTLDECAKLLLNAGASAVYGVVIASGRRDILREAI